MGIRTVKPTSPARRYMSFLTNEEITKKTPEKSLLRPKGRTNGRNAYGRITVRHRGGGAKRVLRDVDFRREKLGIPAKVAGIEYDPKLAETARANAQQLRGRRSSIEILTGDAVDADYREGTVFWMFHPFGPETMREVLEKIRRTLEERPRRIQIAYVNCVYIAEFERLDWLTCVGQKRSPFFTNFSASYWTNEHRPSAGR